MHPEPIVRTVSFLAHNNMKINFQSRQLKGQQGEDLACEYLRDKGFVILGRNIYISNFSEIDIVARSRKGCIVFVEVKSRYNELIHITQLLTQSKLKKLILASKIWLKKWGMPEYETDWRIDLITVIKNREISWFKNII